MKVNFYFVTRKDSFSIDTVSNSKCCLIRSEFNALKIHIVYQRLAVYCLCCCRYRGRCRCHSQLVHSEILKTRIKQNRLRFTESNRVGYSAMHRIRACTTFRATFECSKANIWLLVMNMHVLCYYYLFCALLRLLLLFD